MTDLTRILERAERGEEGAAEHLAAALYEELRAIAGRQMADERTDHTLQPTALVHEAFLRLVGDGGNSFRSRAHFVGAAAVAIRRILVDHARRRAREKRGGGRRRMHLDEVDPVAPIQDDALLALDDALTALARSSPTTARIVELRFFAGLTIPEVAQQMGTSECTIEREWRGARALLRGELEGGDGV